MIYKCDMKEKQLPEARHIVRRLLGTFSRGYPVEKRNRILGRRNIWGLYDCDNERVLIRRGLLHYEQRRTLIHEGIHALYPPDKFPHATEDAVEAKTLEIDKQLDEEKKRRFSFYIPPD